MFPSLGLFKTFPCPQLPHCDRNPCLYSHDPIVEHRQSQGQQGNSLIGGPRLKRPLEPDAEEVQRPSKRQERIERKRNAAAAAWDEVDISPRRSGSQGILKNSRGKKTSLHGPSASPPAPGPTLQRSNSLPSQAGSPLLRESAGISRRSSKAERRAAAAETAIVTSAPSPTVARFQGKGKGPMKVPPPPPTRRAPSAANGASHSPVASTSAQGPEPPTNAGSPRLHLAPGSTSHTPLAARNNTVKAFFDQFFKLYSLLPPASQKSLASKHALQQEMAVHNRTNQHNYRNSSVNTLTRLKKLPQPETEEETGTLEDRAEIESKRQYLEKEHQEQAEMAPKRLRRLIMSKEQMALHEYVVDVPSGKGGTGPDCTGQTKLCERCGQPFVVRSQVDDADRRACAYHWSRRVSRKMHGRKEFIWKCCRAPDAPPCSIGPHVFSEKEPDALHSRTGFISSASFQSSPSKVPVCAMDCELVYTTAGLSLARLSLISADGQVLMDEMVKPHGSVIDLNQRFSGVKEEELRHAVFDIKSARSAMAEFVGKDTIIIGHGLENDLKAMRIVHHNCIDTAQIFPHPAGLPIRYALKALTQQYLKKFIQTGSATEGHSPVEDARAALDLVRFKVRQLTEAER